MPDDDHQAAMRPDPEPFYEPIGGGWINESPEDGDDVGRPPRQDSATRVALRQTADDWLRSVRTVRFWGYKVMVVLGAWLAPRHSSQSGRHSSTDERRPVWQKND